MTCCAIYRPISVSSADSVFAALTPYLCSEGDGTILLVERGRRWESFRVYLNERSS